MKVLLNIQNSNSDTAQLHPKMCSMNLKKDGSVKNLSDEPGITFPPTKCSINFMNTVF